MLSRCRRRYLHLHTGTLLSTSATISTQMTRTPTHHMFCRLLWPTTTSDGALLISATWWIARSPAARRASGASRHSSTGLPTSASCEQKAFSTLAGRSRAEFVNTIIPASRPGKNKGAMRAGGRVVCNTFFKQALGVSNNLIQNRKHNAGASTIATRYDTCSE